MKKPGLPRSSGWIDVSISLHSGMVHWPGDPKVVIERSMDMDRGDVCNLSDISFGSHTGTHMDAPFHFVHGGETIDRMPLDATVGRARVIEIADQESVKPAELLQHRIRRGERVLFKTRNSALRRKGDAFVEDFVYISKEAAEFLARRGIRAVGVDYLSVGGFKRDGPEVHRALLGAGIWILEGLDLSSIAPGAYDLVCLPLRL